MRSYGRQTPEMITNLEIAVGRRDKAYCAYWILTLSVRPVKPELPFDTYEVRQAIESTIENCAREKWQRCPCYPQTHCGEMSPTRNRKDRRVSSLRFPCTRFLHIVHLMLEAQCHACTLERSQKGSRGYGRSILCNRMPLVCKV